LNRRIEIRTFEDPGHFNTGTGRDARLSEIRNIRMGTIIAIILADVLVFLLFVYQYRQELSLTVNGSHDRPVVRAKPPKESTAPADAAGGQGGRGQQVVARP
jgi:hypothetical protein